MPDRYTLPLRYALREVRFGLRHFWLFIGCLMLGVGTIAAVNTLRYAIEEGVRTNAKALLGGDVAVTVTNRAVAQEERAFWQSFGAYSEVIELRAMVSANDTLSLAELKAVDDAYPLVGSVALKSGEHFRSVVGANKVIADESLLLRLGVSVGDEVTIAGMPFAVAGVMTGEPDRIVNTFSFGPRILMTREALARTGLLTPMSLNRSRHRVLLHPEYTTEKFKRAANAQPQAKYWQVQDYTQENQTVERNLERLQLFLTLAALSSLLIGGIGVALSTRAYLKKSLHSIATLKALGASTRTVFGTYLWVLLLMTAIGIVLSVALGIVISYFALPFIREIVPVERSVLFYPEAILLSVWFGYFTVLSFALVPLAKGVAAKPALLLRFAGGEEERVPRRGVIYAALAMLTLAASALLVSGGFRHITLGFIAVALLAFFLFYLFSYLLKRLAAKVRMGRPWLRLAVANIHRPQNSTTPILVAVGTGLSVLVALGLTESNLQKRISETIPQEAPSLFILDIQPDQMEGLKRILASNASVSRIESAPMITGRVVRVAGKPPEQADSDRTVDWAVRGERRFSEAARMPDHTRLAEGEWWPEEYRGPPLLSIDDKVMRGLGLKIGDTLTFDIQGKTVEASIANSRRVDYASMQINFAMVFSPGVMEQTSRSYLATAKVDGIEQEVALIRQVDKQYPNISLIRISESLAQIEEIVSQMLFALKCLIGVVLVTGTLVLAGALLAAQEQRLYDTVVLKVLGARRRTILGAYLAEWSVIALVASGVSTGVGTLGAWLVLKQFRAETFYMEWKLVALVVAGSLATVLTIGLLLNYKVLQAKAAQYLRNE